MRTGSARQVSCCLHARRAPGRPAADCHQGAPGSRRQGPRARRPGRVAQSAAQGSYDEVDELQRDMLARQAEDKEGGFLPSGTGPERGVAVTGIIATALAFGLGVWYAAGPEKAEEYYAGYLLEQSLSIDNLFVFLLVFDAFRVPGGKQDKVLQYGIITAAVLRLVMILLGAELIETFQPVLLVFAAVLLFSSFKILVARGDEEEEDVTNNAVVKFCRRFIKVSDHYDGSNFFTVEDGVRKATPLLLVLAIIEVSDVVFAVDSIPAIFGVTHDPFIVWSSNMFAILSLRGLFAFVSTALKELKYLDKAVAVVLGWIGVKLVVEFLGVEVSTAYSLAVVVLTLGTGVGASLLLKDPPPAGGEGPS